MSRFTHDVCHGEPYKAKDGTDKRRYTKVGAAFTSDDGKISLKIEYIPVGTGPIWLSLFRRRRISSWRLPKPRRNTTKTRCRSHESEKA